MSGIEELKAKFKKYGQEHVFHDFDQLSESQKDALTQRLESVDLDELVSLHKVAMKRHNLTESQDAIKPWSDVDRLSSEERARMFQSGLEEIAHGRVAAILMGGGQGTRLGSSEPKGLFNVNLPSGKSLLNIQADRLKKLQQMAGKHFGKTEVPIPWYVMTSPATCEMTEAYFQKNAFFGLGSDNVKFFAQDQYPVVLENGKIGMSSNCTIGESPNGNGGIYQAVVRDKVLEELKKRGIEYVFIYGVDNIAIRICDPAFIGLMKSKGGDCGVKVVPKDYPAERVGVVALRNNLPSVVEYSELDPNTAQKVDEASGKLMYNTGNICTHLYSIDFLEKSCNEYHTLTKHVAHKKIPYYDFEKKELIRPEKENGFKFEMFVFDVFALAKNMVVMEVVREEEFLPLKNKDGTANSNPTTCREGISNLHKKYLRNAGAELVGEGLCEVSALVSYAGEGLEKLKGKKIQLPCHVSIESFPKL